MINKLVKAALLCSIAAMPNLVNAQSETENDSVVTYEKDYFTKYDPVTLLDMLQRVPGVQAILDSNSRNNGGGTARGGQQERGFGSGGDQILINNKRLAGKENNINSALQRISATQVERVEIIRGASGDLDVQSQGLVVNVIMEEGVSTSSTFWNIGGKYSVGYAFSPDLQVSHNGSSGNLDYMFGVEAKQGQHIEHRDDTYFTPDHVKTEIQERKTNNKMKYIRLNSNLSYSWDSGDELRLNGQFEPGKYTKREPRFSELVNMPRTFQNWSEDQTSQKWEVGGDYTHKFDGFGTWKTLFIVNRDRIDKRELYQNVFDTGNIPNFRDNEYRIKKEKIVRSSLTIGIFDNQLLEVGGEAAINNFDKIFTNEDYDLGAYTVTVNDDVAVKENRFEAFANHTLNISSNMVLQSSLIGEFSKISSLTIPLIGANIEKSKKFSFLKPRLDFRYDFTGRDQLRASVEKKVSQLDFQNFVATYDTNNDVLRLGNTGIVPEKSWNYSVAYEHRLINDAGALQVEFFYRDIKDFIELVDFTEFYDENGVPIPRADIVPVSKSGNIPKARSYGIKTTGSLRLGFIGLPEAVFSIDHTWEDSDVIDQFSGVHRPFKWKSAHLFTFNYRHDVTDWGFSYGVKGTLKSRNGRHEINEVNSTYNGDLYEAFAELKIWNDYKLIFKFEHITPLKYTTDVKVYKDHIRYNELDHLETNNWRYVKEYSVFLQGTF
ncbi:MAG: TonB-dependent receptor plug domain-containing protein [Alphaproteobacteria bacterium]|nr:TonB-dependent receptor plug domain-containing protein [Alphaproteobacteria bacterium]HPF46515.1 TonB-dependent receptor plug domain-containing protein [Emcibacteraceae bacterium]HRW29096.1 TonB-dependent receptor plug domain-containing protein [Emcibacteraceae bacterium]